jgi:methionyl-tRNA formyltransferase
MGTPEFACRALLALIESKYDIAGVVTRPDKPRGRGMKISFSPVKELALKNNLNIYQPQKLDTPEFIDILKKISPDLIAIVAFGRIIPKEILELPKYGCINLHPSLLPKYRGASPIPAAILVGDKKTGVTTFYVNEKLDSGDIILQQEEKIAEDDTSATLAARLAQSGAELLIETIAKIEGNQVVRISQEDSEATHTSKLKKEDGFIDWKESALQIARVVRAMDPWPGAYTYFAGRLVKIWGAEVSSGDNQQLSGSSKPGEVVKVTKEGIIVACGEGFLLVRELQPAGKGRMDSLSFAAGYRVKEGSILRATE